jgi:hypothetical protein
MEDKNYFYCKFCYVLTYKSKRFREYDDSSYKLILAKYYYGLNLLFLYHFKPIIIFAISLIVQYIRNGYSY